MFRSRPHALLIAAGACAALLLSGLSAHAQQAEPGYDSSAQVYDNSDQAPGRVARIAYISGQVQFAPAGEDSWGSIEVNRPMVIGDRLLTGEDGRAVLELGDASVRLDQDSAFDFLNLEQDNVQIELSQGTVNLAVHRMDQGANFEIDTPTVAFVASTPGNYRVDNDPDGIGSIVTVFQGSGVVYGENGSSRQVAAGQSYRFDDSTLASVEVNGLPEPDDFDRFCEARDQRYEQYAQQSQQYVPPEMIGGQDLEQYGQWSSTPDYGTVWYPNTVPSGWAPYRYGHWAWIEPWGWTWVDNQPWGFAPFHYGRWVYVRSRWGWMPGPVNVRPVYAPALVGFLGGSGVSLSVNIGNGPVGWFPLGPRDVYVPWFHASRGYFTNVNITNIRRVYVNRTIINNRYGDYRSGRRWSHGRHDYPYRHLPGAVTAVDRNIFTGARPVHPAVLKLDRNRLARFEVANRPGVNPGRASLGVRNPTHRPGFAHGREPFSRPVVARHRPPPRPVSFATREKVIATQHGQPLTPVQLRNLQQHRTTTHPDRRRNVKLATAGNAGHAPPRPAEPGAVARAPVHSRVPPRPAEPSARPGSGPTRPPFKNTVRPIQVPARPIASRPASKTPPRPNELPSARFAHPERRAGQLPHVPVIRPAGNEPAHRTGPERRLPVVRPVQSAPRAIAQRNEPASRPPVRTAPQPPRAPTLQQQRRVDDQRQQVQQQAQQRAAREQQAQQQQAQRARQQQAQQQAQRARQQQMQQQAFRAREQQQARQVQMRREPQVRQQPQRARPEPRNAPRRAPPPPRSSKQHDNNRREHRQ